MHITNTQYVKLSTPNLTINDTLNSSQLHVSCNIVDLSIKYCEVKLTISCSCSFDKSPYLMVLKHTGFIAAKKVTMGDTKIIYNNLLLHSHNHILKMRSQFTFLLLLCSTTSNALGSCRNCLALFSFRAL